MGLNFMGPLIYGFFFFQLTGAVQTVLFKGHCHWELGICECEGQTLVINGVLTMWIGASTPVLIKGQLPIDKFDYFKMKSYATKKFFSYTNEKGLIFLIMSSANL